MDRLLKIGIVGAAVSALCCFTPVLVGVFSVLGLSALTGYLDIVLLPLLLFFVVLIVVALYRRKRALLKIER